ncbi:MAG: arginine deiminase family protein [candidate division Zixibacteria bacterium]|nr:arginine deiminase family protein [candidate division Zixibacteria bacterium]
MPLHTEYEPLKRVVIHEPGYEWNLVTVEHDMPEKYLIEDVLFTQRAASDHREFSDCLRHAAGPGGVVEFTELLAEILSDREVCSDVVGAVSALEGVGIGTHDYLLSENLAPRELALLLVAGAFRPGDRSHQGYRVFFPPIPNLMFTRDLGIFFGDTVVLSHPAKGIRRREGLLARYIFRNHPMFADIQIVDVLDDATEHAFAGHVHLEGGDVIVLDSDTILVGSSERTSDSAIQLLARRLLTNGMAKRLIKVLMPRDRATMHLDTVFTIIGRDDCVYYPPFFSEGTGASPLNCITYELSDGELTVVDQTAPRGLFSALERLGYAFPNRVPCGGDIPHYQTREQWTDGANLFAARPRVAFIYERNTQTISAFQKNGYNVLSPSQFLKTDPATVDRTLVTLSGAELSRGRGGARCMTMPVSRS